MYLAYWNFKEKPFENTPDPRFFYHSPSHEEALMRMVYAIRQRKGAAMLTGEYGSGKTVLTRTLLRDLLREADVYKVALIVNPSLSAEDFLREIIFQLENKVVKEGKFDLIHTLNTVLYRNVQERKEAIIIVDEAQVIKSEETLEELRLLLNFQMNDRFLLTLVLVGQPELRDKINSIPQIKQRLAITFHLKGLAEENVADYIMYRCAIAGRNGGLFEKNAMRAIAYHSGGIPRKINTICELTLLEGMFEKKSAVDEDLVEKVLEDVPL